jgi:CBS domain-containing protein
MSDRKSLPTAGQVMQREVFTLDPGQDVLDAVRSLLARRISGAPVVENGVVVGMFSERDSLKILGAAAYDAEPSGTVAQHMRRTVVCAREHTDVFGLAQLFETHPIRRIPVVDEGFRLLGLVTRSDVLMKLLTVYLDSELRVEPKTPYDRVAEFLAPQ